METMKDLLEEAKRRTILVALLVLIVAYVMSLTSSSVWINLPVSIIVLAVLRRVSFEIEIRWKPRMTEGQPRLQHQQHLHRRRLTNYDPLLSSPSQMAANRWRHNINSPIVEAAVDELTRCVIDEWVNDLWYSSITPDQEAPEELRILLNGAIAEVAQRARRVNLITLLSKDMVDLIGTHFELYRRMKAKIGPDIIGSLSMEERDEKLKHAMMSSHELHPALISLEAEYKVLKKLTGGVVALVLKRQDAQCRLLRTLARELLACAVLRPVLNFASPGYINELIETLAVASSGQTRQASEKATEDARQRVPDRVPQRKPSLAGLEMIPLGTTESRGEGLGTTSLHKDNAKMSTVKEDIGTSAKPQLSVDTKSSKDVRREQLGFDDQGDWGPIPSGDWAQVLDAVTQRRAQALTPEHLDNLWAKGRNYKKRESTKAATEVVTTRNSIDPGDKSIPPLSTDPEVLTKPSAGNEIPTSTQLGKDSVPTPTSVSEIASDLPSPEKKQKSASEQYGALLFGDPKEDKERLPGIGFSPLGTPRHSSVSPEASSDSKNVISRKNPELVKSHSIEDLSDLSKHSRSNSGISVHSSERSRKSGSGTQRLKRAVRLLSHRKSRSTGGGLDGWQDLEGGSVQGLLTLLNTGESPSGESPRSEHEQRKTRRKDMSCSLIRDVSPVLTAEATPRMWLCMLQCRVMGAHFEKIGSKAFAVYSIRVKDGENRSWEVQRRFRNFEQLHRRLKDMPYYTLSLPPKRFLSSSIDNNFVRERCILLNKYLKDLLAIPSVAELHEVWDFLSVNSQHYTYGSSSSMMKTLAVNVDDAMDDMFRQIRGVSDDISGALKTATSGIRQRFPVGSGDMSQSVVLNSIETSTPLTPESLIHKLPGPSPPLSLADGDFGTKALGNSVSEDEYGEPYVGHREGSIDWKSDTELHIDSSDIDMSKTGAHTFASGHLDLREHRNYGSRLERTLSDGHSPAESFASETVEDDLVIPSEWSPPKVSVPLLNLVDLIFQLQGRGWIRRQVLWMAKQILQLGMGDAIDDWLIGRIQWLRREEVVASGIQWMKGVLWPDGVFVSKHPRNLSPVSSAVLEESEMVFAEGGQHWQQPPPINSFEHCLEAARQAGVVREIILDKAPATLVNLIGKKQYARCAKDVYYFSQSTVCMKQLTYSLLEMLLLAAFPELQDLILDVRSSVA